MSDLPDFAAFCEDACIKAWGEPDRKSPKEFRWGNDSYNYRTYDVRKHVWYDAGAQCGGSTLELAAFAKGQPVKQLRGAAFYEAWQYAYDRKWLPDPPPSKPNGGGGKPIIATYPYHDEQGQLLFEVVRFDTAESQGRFRQRQPDGQDGWVWNTKGVRRVLYRLPELVAAVQAGQLVLVCEGEKDANSAAKLGYAATTMPGGVGKWCPEYDELLRGSDIVVVSDNDEQLRDPKTGKLQFHPDGRPVLPGQDHAAKLAKRLSKVAARVRSIIFPQKDLTEWVAAGGTRERLDALIERAPVFARKAQEEPSEEPRGQEMEGDYMTGNPAWNCNVGNVLLALEKEPPIKNAFGYDEMLRVEVLLRPLFREDPNFKPRPVTDADVCAVQAWLQWFGFRRIGKGTVYDAIDKHAREQRFNPVRNHLESLSWDGKPRLGTWLTTYLGVASTSKDGEAGYVEEVGKMFLIGMVARIFAPGCKLDYMLVLEGGQGFEKSMACAVLAGDKYFTDQLPDITSKECSQHLRGRWLIEVAELNAYSRAAVDHFKAFLVRQIERYRPPFARKEVSEPRQCAFIGTTNKTLYLRDETGNRRFWPVAVGEMKLDDLRRDRDQLLAEAVHLYRAGVHWWPDRDFEQSFISPEQESRYASDAWEPLIRQHLAILHVPKRTSILRIAVNVLDYEAERPLMPTDKDEPQPARGTPINRFGIKEQARIAAILTHLGWVPKRTMHERWWEPGPRAVV
jgi:hypothetical protein